MDAMRSGVRRCAARLVGPALLAVFIIMTAATGSAQQLEGATWRAERIKGGAVAGTAPTLAVAGGRLSGSGGCNRLMGSVDVSSGSIALGGVASTRMACEPPIMAQEKAFLAALGATRSFRVEGAHLVFLDEAGAETVRFVQQP